MEISDLDMVLRWRNHPSVREHSGSDHEIFSLDHEKWFSNESIKLLFLLNDQPSGVVHLNHIGEEVVGNVYEWSFYLNPFCKYSEGTGTLMLTLAMQFIRSKATGIIGKVKMENHKSTMLHSKLGFQEVLPSMDMKFRRFYKSL